MTKNYLLNTPYKKSIICAMDQNNGIGKDNDLVWKGDLKHFKETTTDSVIIMGRNTFESLKSNCLPNRLNIVISTTEPKSILQTSYFEDNMLQFDKPLFFNDVFSALEFLNNIHSKSNTSFSDVYFIGGSSLYESVFNIVDELLITKIHNTFDCDKYFDLDYETYFKEVDHIQHFNPKHGHYSIVHYSRKTYSDIDENISITLKRNIDKESVVGIHLLFPSNSAYNEKIIIQTLKTYIREFLFTYSYDPIDFRLFYDNRSEKNLIKAVKDKLTYQLLKESTNKHYPNYSVSMAHHDDYIGEFGNDEHETIEKHIDDVFENTNERFIKNVFMCSFVKNGVGNVDDLTTHISKYFEKENTNSETDLQVRMMIFHILFINRCFVNHDTSVEHIVLDEMEAPLDNFLHQSICDTVTVYTPYKIPHYGVNQFISTHCVSSLGLNISVNNFNKKEYENREFDMIWIDYVNNDSNKLFKSDYFEFVELIKGSTLFENFKFGYERITSTSDTDSIKKSAQKQRLFYLHQKLVIQILLIINC